MYYKVAEQPASAGGLVIYWHYIFLLTKNPKGWDSQQMFCTSCQYQNTPSAVEFSEFNLETWVNIINIYLQNIEMNHETDKMDACIKFCGGKVLYQLSAYLLRPI